MKKHDYVVEEELVGLLGKTCDRELAEKFNIPESRVKNLRYSLGIKPYRKFKKTGNPRFPLVSFTDEEIYREYKSMGTLEQVARKYGCTRQAVFLHIQRYRRDTGEI